MIGGKGTLKPLDFNPNFNHPLPNQFRRAVPHAPGMQEDVLWGLAGCRALRFPFQTHNSESEIAELVECLFGQQDCRIPVF